LVFNNEYVIDYCIKCGKKYDYDDNKWCKQCQINQLKNNFTNWTSGNEKIDDLIQKTQLKINNCNDTIFEWIPYNEFINIKEIIKGKSASAIWKDGPLYYSTERKKYGRKLNEKVFLKYSYNSQDIINNFLNEV
jgi:hypothetical protein